MPIYCAIDRGHNLHSKPFRSVRDKGQFMLQEGTIVMVCKIRGSHPSVNWGQSHLIISPDSREWRGDTDDGQSISLRGSPAIRSVNLCTRRGGSSSFCKSAMKLEKQISDTNFYIWASMCRPSSPKNPSVVLVGISECAVWSLLRTTPLTRMGPLVLASTGNLREEQVWANDSASILHV